MIIELHTDNKDYDIVLERGALAKVGQLIDLDRKVLVVTDTGVPEAYADTVAAQSAVPVIVRVPQGEDSKDMERFSQLLSAMLNAGFSRNDCVVAVGGGVVGDLSGFAASCYMRGIDFYNIPTTLLSQVDSSIGGKTAIDFEGVKNIVGAFNQPDKVIIDPDTLNTLSDRQLAAGLAESIKMSATYDAELFEFIAGMDLGTIREQLPEVIRRSLLIKRDVVQKDPREKGLRKVLNFGHTIGHGIESYLDGQLLHGECVALGMLPMCSEPVKTKLVEVLQKYGLPVSFEGDTQDIIPIIMHDKKKLKNEIRTVVVDSIGTFRFVNMDEKELRERAELL